MLHPRGFCTLLRARTVDGAQALVSLESVAKAVAGQGGGRVTREAELYETAKKTAAVLRHKETGVAKAALRMKLGRAPTEAEIDNAVRASNEKAAAEGGAARPLDWQQQRSLRKAEEKRRAAAAAGSGGPGSGGAERRHPYAGRGPPP